MSHSFSGLMGLGGSPADHLERALEGLEEVQIQFRSAALSISAVAQASDKYEACRNAQTFVEYAYVRLGHVEAHMMELRELEKTQRGRMRLMDLDMQSGGKVTEAFKLAENLHNWSEGMTVAFKNACLKPFVNESPYNDEIDVTPPKPKRLYAQGVR